ncbi:MAG: hypothetical protein OFPI_41410 [Osedax symbiont Rs2]|nr:MAG: hypothetical protein OFPI_41410 [Osedax symbiont Rs2]
MWFPKQPAEKIGVNGLVQSIEKAILEQQLKVGDRLPPQRILAYKLKVNPTTVSRAYQRAAEKGLVGGQIGRGTYVLAQSNAALFNRCLLEQQQGVIDLSINKLECDETLLKINQRIYADNVFFQQPLYFEYIGAGVIQRYQLAITQWLQRARDIDFQAQQILPLPSCQYAIHFIFSKLLKRGDLIIVEQFTAPGIIAAAKQHGLRLFTCKCDDQGLIPSALASTIKQTNSKVLITVPSNQSPLGTTQSEQRRRELAQVIKEQQLLVIEEDIYGMYSKPAPLAKYAPENTLLLSGFSKCLSGGHKAAFIASRHPMLENLAKHVIETVWLVSSSATSHIISAIENKHLDAAIKHVSAKIQTKNLLLNTIMHSDLNLSNPHHWIESNDEFIQQAAQAGVILAHSDNFSVTGGTEKAVFYRLGVSSIDIDKIKKAAIVLAGLK